MITHSAEGYVQDERYVAGAGKRRSDFLQIGIVFMDAESERHRTCSSES